MTFDREALRATVTVADGGWSTCLRARGLAADIAAETANQDSPELVLELTRAYVKAGARVVTTNTFGANRFNLERYALTADALELNKAGAALARQAVGTDDVLVAGTIGPSGKILAVSEVPAEELHEMFAQQAAALVSGGAEAILLETFSELAEVLLAVQAVKQAVTLPVIASMSFDSGPQRTRTVMGAAAEDCAAALEDAGADAVGCNCGSGIETALPAVVALRGATELPLWVKPNAGLPELVDGRPVYRQSPDEFVARVPPLLDAGANIVGGCCGTGPEHIRRLARLVARRSTA